MRSDRVLGAIDFHTAGIGMRLLTSGLGRLGGLTRVEGRPAILPEIAGTAHLTGFSQQLFDPDDPVRGGYLLDV
jgi:proline racemase